jgi:Bacterial antitoxin of type II TA system, VapB
MATVEVDDKLLSEALDITGETATELVEKSLKEAVRLARLKRGIEWLRTTPDIFWPNYLEDIRPNSWAAIEKRGETPIVREAGDVKRGAGSR